MGTVRRIIRYTRMYGLNFKLWYNQYYWRDRLRAVVRGESTYSGPWNEFCGHAWCFRWARYDHRCGEHQGDPY